MQAEVLETPERILLKSNDQALFQIKESVKTFAPLLTELREAWNEMGIGPASLDEIARHYPAPEKWVREKVYEQTPALKNMPIEKSFALQMVNLPNGFNRFVSVMAELNSLRMSSRYADLITTDLYWNQDKNGNFSTSKAFDEYLDRACNVYATEKQTQIYRKAQEAVAAMQEIQTLSKRHNIIAHGHGLITCNYFDSGKLAINMDLLMLIK